MNQMSPVALSGYHVATKATVDYIWRHGLNLAIQHSRVILNHLDEQMKERQLEEYESGEYRCYSDFIRRHKFKESESMDLAEQGIAIDKQGAIC